MPSVELLSESRAPHGCRHTEKESPLTTALSTSALEQRGTELMCCAEISSRGRKRSMTPCSVCFFMLWCLLRCWVWATGASGLATDLSNCQGCRFCKESLAELDCVSQFLLDLKICQSKGSLRNIPKEKDMLALGELLGPLIQ